MRGSAIPQLCGSSSQSQRGSVDNVFEPQSDRSTDRIHPTLMDYKLILKSGANKNQSIYSRTLSELPPGAYLKLCQMYAETAWATTPITKQFPRPIIYAQPSPAPCMNDVVVQASAESLSNTDCPVICFPGSTRSGH